MNIRVGTRGSQLATTQSGHVADRLRDLTGRTVELVRIRTDGDVLTGPLSQMGGTGVFVTAIRQALLDGRCDVAVHSLKDLPTAQAPGLVIATPPREDPRDALCSRDGTTLVTLPDGARVGTGSPRRAAQLLVARPDLTIVDIRGNVGTRLDRALGTDADLDAVILAVSGLNRIGRADAITEHLDPNVIVPAPGQGSLAVEVRTEALDDPEFAAAFAAVDDPATHLAVTAERALLRRLEAGCSAPVGAYGVISNDGTELVLHSVVARVDGTDNVRRSGSIRLGGLDRLDQHDYLAAADALGIRVAENLLDAGAADLAPLAESGA